ncbi:hypothetical protein KFU94_49755 [Chloroflexi bacterium TSY]|nr:hypothetical protein [Chloroflexi bacterium TSY]
MQQKSVHEPDARLMSADDVWEDAQQISSVLHRNQPQSEPIVRLPIPLSVFVSALEQFSRDELIFVRQRIEERLAA